MFPHVLTGYNLSATFHLLIDQQVYEKAYVDFGEKIKINYLGSSHIPQSRSQNVDSAQSKGHFNSEVIFYTHLKLTIFTINDSKTRLILSWVKKFLKVYNVTAKQILRLISLILSMEKIKNTYY